MYVSLALFPFLKSREVKCWGLQYLSWQHPFSDAMVVKAVKVCFQTTDFIAGVCDVWIFEHVRLCIHMSFKWAL